MLAFLVTSLTLFFNALQALDHRGPDDSGYFFSDTHPIALGHTRLSILDLSSLGHQPMFSPCGEVAIVFNGEIYNYRQLREELRLVGYAFNSDTDTEVLLNLYLHCGDQLLHRLNGIFTFAIWDGRSSSLLMARDPIGVKPFITILVQMVLLFLVSLSHSFSLSHMQDN